ncbi:MAG: glycosyltransferase family 2 protein [Candidatus Kariarchaeaceae archaeon]
MKKHYWAILIKLLFYFIWILIFLHLYKGLEELVNHDLIFWQIVIISLQLTFEVVMLSQINLLLYGIRVILLTSFSHPEFETLTTYPTIDIVIPTRRIETKTLELTLEGFKNQSYPQDQMKIYIADDTPELDRIKELTQLCEKYNVEHISKPENVRYKAGMLNLTLPYLESEFVAFFDHDQIPEENIINRFVQIFSTNGDIDFIQAKKAFRGLDNIFKIWSALLYALYFEVFERTKRLNDVVLFAGSTACFRRAAIDAVGGIPEDSFTEDNGLSVRLIMDGKRGYYYDNIGSIGTVPPTFRLQIAQLWRWSNGASHVLKNNFRTILFSRELKFNQKMDLIATFGISPLVVFIYVYGLSFIPLILSGVDSSRLVIYGVSSVILVPVFAAVAYTILASISISLAKSDGISEFKFNHLPGFLFIALGSNLLVIMSGLTGIFGLFGPNSKFGRWTRKVRINLISIIGLILGVIIEYYAIQWMNEGFSSASLMLILGLTLIPSFIITFIIPLSRKPNPLNS